MNLAVGIDLMQVTKITPSSEVQNPAASQFAQEQLQQEFNFLQAERITKKLLEKGIITTDQYDRIMAENKRTFPTYLAPIL